MNTNQSRFHSTGNDGLLNVFIMSMLPVNGLMWFQPADPVLPVQRVKGLSALPVEAE